MSLHLDDTNASQIASALVDTRRAAGSPAMGMVLTMVVVVPEKDAEESLKAVREAAKEHPSRQLGVVIGSARGASNISAEIATGAETVGERALIRLTGPVAKHPESVVLWWPTEAPDDPAGDPLGRLGTRRITDAAQVTTGKQKAMQVQCASYAPGNTDLAWTRITPWRALLAAALDQTSARVTGASVTGERISPSVDLLSAWLADRLKVPVERGRSDGPGITNVTLQTKKGDIVLSRDDGRLATLQVPGQPDRPVALRRREVPELLAEELRRLDPDDIYAATVRRMQKGHTPRKRAARAKRATPAKRAKRAKG
jgi:glucose-6-phosphate dehydrogenase assembly protein OpcA